MKKANFIYSIVMTTCSYVASMIVFPYVSRVLGAEGLGNISFVNQISQYFLLFAMLGVVSVGTREIAMCGEDKDIRSHVFNVVFSLSLLCTMVVFLIYLACIFFVPYFRNDRALFLIGSANILFTALQIEWLFRGIEDFKYITIRGIIVRIIYVIAVLIFVRKEEDYVLYFLLTVLIVIVNALINIWYGRKHIKFDFSLSNVKEGFKRFFKPFVTLGTNSIMNSFYSTFNVVYLGIVCSKESVGYYYVSNKIMTMCLGVISAFTLVMMPRMSNLIGEKSYNEYERILDKSFKLIIDFAVPICLVLFLFAPEVVTLLSGDAYGESVTPLRIITPVMLINALAQIVVFQVQMPQKKDQSILTASIIGAVVGVSLNLLIVKQWGVVGTAITLLLSVGSTFVYNMGYCMYYKLMKFPFKYFVRSILLSLPYVAIFIGIRLLPLSWLYRLIIGLLLCAIYWLLMNYKTYKVYIPFKIGKIK